ncbi:MULTISPECIES: CCA tRNA nucleotidyltransferase [Salinibaculum]|uniref:CCA tRNA nucleotidyltransferase n=1 Tax=Salinibaculum TaxID=2732368 RepID=UPI0030CF9863
MTDEFAAVVSRVRERVTPTPAERERLEDVVNDLTDRAEEAVADLPVDADVLLVGSTARNTWIAGDRDIDLFVSFPPDLDREDLERYGLQVGHAVLPDGHEEYAEHPYVVGEYDGYEVDCVPCYNVEDATDIQSAVDRTPFHTRYLESRLDHDLADEVRVCKQFFKAIGVYGSDLRTRGFSGFLTELLVVEYGGFRPLVEAAADWHPPVELDPEDHGEESFEDPLVVIDPTDPERNVAAVLSAENVARLQHHARELLADPREELFERTERDPFSAADVREAVADRGTTPVALRFTAPDIVEDQLWPQLEKSRAGIAAELDRRGFDVFRSDAFATDGAGDGSDEDDAGGETAVVLFELAVAERPRVERHEGPPVHVREHARGFSEKYADSEEYGPFVDGDRYVVERAREFTTAADLLSSDALFEMALGAHVESSLAAGYDVLVGEEIASLADSFGAELAAYFDPRP